MSDTGRQSFTDKVGAAVKPDSQKSTTEHMGDKFKGKTDSAASSLQPQSEKSTTQKVGDAFSSNSNETQVRPALPVVATVVCADVTCVAFFDPEGEERDGPRRQLGDTYLVSSTTIHWAYTDAKHLTLRG